MPRAAKPKTKRPSGAYRARAAQRTLLQAWTTPEIAEKIRAAASADNRLSSDALRSLKPWHDCR